MSVDKAERVANLVAFLLDVDQPVSLRRIVEQIDGYPDEYDVARVYFARDRKVLASEGVVITTTGEGDNACYRIDPSSYYLPDLGLDADETAALNLAASAVRIEGTGGEDALLKLGVFASDGPALVSLPADRHLAVAYEAVRERLNRRLIYVGMTRASHELVLTASGNHPYIADLEA